MKTFTTVQDGASFTIECLKQLKRTISNQSEIYFNDCNELKHYQDETDVFKMKYRKFEAASSEDVATMFFTLFIGLPMLLLVDYASLIDFIVFMGSRIGGSFGSFLGANGFMLFGLFELGVGAYVIRTRKQDREGKVSKFKIWIGRLLMTVVVIMPLILIYTGYTLDEDKTLGKLFKTVVLMLLSFGIHVYIFAAIETIWNAIIYFFVYKIKSWRLASSNPMDKLLRIRNILLESYQEYDDHLSEFDKLPAEIKSTFNPQLGKREHLLKQKLTNDIPGDDYDVSDIINTKFNVEHSQNGSATVVNSKRGKIGFKYYTTSSTL